LLADRISHEAGKTKGSKLPTFPNHAELQECSVMAKNVFSKTDILALSKRIDSRSRSRTMDDQPEMKRDMQNASQLLVWFLAKGIPGSVVEIDNEDNGTTI
jgi:hypothetical protein